MFEEVIEEDVRSVVMEIVVRGRMNKEEVRFEGV